MCWILSVRSCKHERSGVLELEETQRHRNMAHFFDCMGVEGTNMPRIYYWEPQQPKYRSWFASTSDPTFGVFAEQAEPLSFSRP